MNDHQISQEHLNNPKVGDYWHEMLMPVAIVIDVNDDEITICGRIKDTGEGCWTWDQNFIKIITKKEMREYFSYDTIPNKTWCRCIPEGHKEWVMEWNHHNMDKIVNNLFESIME